MGKKISGSDFVDYLKRKQNLLQQGAELINSKRYDELIGICDNLIKQNPRTAEAWMLKGAALRKKREFKQAFECLDNALKQSLMNWQALQEMAFLQLDLGNITQAIRAFEGVIQWQLTMLSTVQPPVLFNIALCHETIGQFEKAIEYYDKFLMADPLNLNAWIHKAMSQKHNGNVEEALQSFNKVLDLDPKSQIALREKKFLNKDLEHKDLAIIKNQIFLGDGGRSSFQFPKDLENAEKIDLPPDKMNEYKTAKTNIMMNHGVSMHELGGGMLKARDEIISLDKAIEESNKALSIVPYDLEVIFEKGKALLQLKKYDEAVKHFDDALKLESKLGTFMQISGAYYKNIDQKEIDKNIGLVWLYRARALEEIGQYDNALDSYKKAKEYSDKLRPPQSQKKEATKDPQRTSLKKFCISCGNKFPQKTIDTFKNKGKAFCPNCGKLYEK